MNTDSTACDYAQRAVRALGQEAHDPEKVAMWCYDHPPRKKLPAVSGERNNNIFVSRKLRQCLSSVGKSFSNGATFNSVDALAEAVLTLFVKEHAPALWTMHERHRQEEDKLLTELRQNEPELQLRKEV